MAWVHPTLETRRRLRRETDTTLMPPRPPASAPARPPASIRTQAVHGGELASSDFLDDLWLFNPTTASWSENRDSTTGPRPCARSSHCLAYSKSAAELSQDRSAGGSADDFSGGSLVLFGGLGQDTDEDSDAGDVAPLNDLWVWSSCFASGGSASHLHHASEICFWDKT